jgi:predicted nucleotidyltransferase
VSERVWTRRKILEDKLFVRTVDEVASFMERTGLRYALVGGIAVAIHANPPVTIDADFLVGEDDMAVLRSFFKDSGWSVVPLLFSSRQKGIPTNGWAIRKKGRTSIDLISTSGDSFLMRALVSAVPREIGGHKIPVITVENLIVMKTLIGRDKDIDDTVALRQANEVDDAYINKTLEHLW